MMDFSKFYEICDIVLHKTFEFDETEFALTMSAIIDCYELYHTGANSLAIANTILSSITEAKESNYSLGNITL